MNPLLPCISSAVTLHVGLWTLPITPAPLFYIYDHNFKCPRPSYFFFPPSLFLLPCPAFAPPPPPPAASTIPPPPLPPPGCPSTPCISDTPQNPSQQKVTSSPPLFSGSYQDKNAPCIISLKIFSLIPPPLSAGLCSGNTVPIFHPSGTAGGSTGPSGAGIPWIRSRSGVCGVDGWDFR